MRRLIIGVILVLVVGVIVEKLLDKEIPPQAKFAVSNSVLDVSGGTVSGGGFRIQGTVGQQVAGVAKNNAYTHTVGFWLLP